MLFLQVKADRRIFQGEGLILFFQMRSKAVLLLVVSFVEAQRLQLSGTTHDPQTYSLLAFLIQLKLKQTNESNYS